MSEFVREKVGPYRILKRLGEGGMGVVDLAEDTRTGARVAIKHLTRVSGPLLDALRREVRALAELEHPSIVRIFEHDLLAEVPWYAMEYVGATSLRDHLTKRSAQVDAYDSGPTHLIAETLTEDSQTFVSTPPLLPTLQMESLVEPSTSSAQRVPSRKDWEAMLASLCDVCAGLSALHAVGIVHRDLKPENILFREDGRAVIVDFGISMQTRGVVGREKLTRAMRTAGTPAYLSPEQATNRPVDARSDLYSLGCLMFEVVTGTVPFDDPSVIRVLQHQAFTPAPSARRINPEIPEALDSLIQRLMQKAPHDRLGYAIDVDTALRNILGLAPPTYEAPYYIYSPAMVGRDEEFRELVAFCRDVATKDAGNTIVISGEAGIGKTRLIYEVVQEINQELSVYFGFGDPNRQLPFGVFFSAWRAIAQDEPEQARLIRLRRDSWWDELVKGTRPVNLDDVKVAYEVLTNLAKGAPRIIVLDDAQWIDDWSVMLIDRLIRFPVHQLGLMILTRSDERGSSRLPETRRLELGRLGHEDVQKVLRSMTGVSQVSDIYVRYALEETEGNPFFLAELTRTAMRTGVLRRDQNGRWHVAAERRLTPRDAVPRSERIEESMRSQIALLSPSERVALDWCAVVGVIVEPGLLVAVASPEAVGDVLETGLIHWHGARLRFKHVLLARVVYEQIPPEDLPSMHLAVAEYLEAHPKTEVNPYELGRHFQLGGALPRAEVYLWNSVQQAMRVGLHADSVHQLHAWMRAYTGDPEVFWERVLGYLKDHFSASTLLFGEVCRYLVEKARLYGNPDLLAMMISYRIRATPEPEWGERHALLQEAYKCLPSCTSLLPRIHVLRAHRSVEETEGCRNVDALHNETIRVAQEFGDDEEILESLLEFAVEMTTRSRYQESQALLDAAEALVKSKSVSKRLEIDYMLARATLAGDLGNRALAIELYLKALEHLRLFGADRQLCVVQWNVANQYFLAKRYTEALAMLREAETVSGYMPFYDMRGMVAMSLAELQAHMGEIEGARGLYLRARDVFNHPANDHLRLVTYFDALYATFLRRQGLLDEAEVYLPEPSDDHYVNAKIWAERGFLRLAQGLDAQEAMRACSQSVEAAGFSPLSEPWMLRDALQRAADAPADALWFGECVADLPPALHAALVARQA